MIFNKWCSVFEYTGRLYIMVDEKFIGDNHTLDFSKFKLELTTQQYPKHFFDNSSPYLGIYFKFVNHKYNSLTNLPHNKIYIFKKNKLYNFKSWYDELDNEVFDVWYDPFIFVKEEDYEQAIRFLKLKKLMK